MQRYILKLEYSKDVRKSDLEKGCQALIEVGVSLSERDFKKAWGMFSEECCAKWLDIPEDGETIWNCISELFEREFMP